MRLISLRLALYWQARNTVSEDSPFLDFLDYLDLEHCSSCCRKDSSPVMILAQEKLFKTIADLEPRFVCHHTLKLTPPTSCLTPGGERLWPRLRSVCRGHFFLKALTGLTGGPLAAKVAGHD
jgi:hypothetical protein